MHLKGFSPPMRRSCGHVRGGTSQQMNGLFDFLTGAGSAVGKGLNTVVNPLQSAAQSVIQVKQAIDQSKLAWQGIPYTVNEQGFAIPTQPGATGERFVPGTATIATGNGITSATNDTLSKSELLQLQTALKNKGYDPGPLDGLYGPKTQAGIKAFQSANGLPVTGAATFDLLSRLTAVASNPTQIPNNPSAPIVTSYPQSPVYSPTVPYYQTPQVVTVQEPKSELPNWAIPAAIGGGGLLLILAMGSGRRR